jgi:hypothetical protein
MSISLQQKPADVQLKVVTVNKEQALKTSNGVASSKIFTISFSYLKKAYRTKVMKVIYADNEPMYKVVMPCNINNGTSIHWLKRQEKNWTVLLGEKLDEKLLKAVTAAIDCLE